MDLSRRTSQARFDAYVEALVEVIGHADRAKPLNDYCVGLLMPGERKSVEPMAAIVAPTRVSAKHQSLLHLVGEAPWSDEAVLGPGSWTTRACRKRCYGVAAKMRHHRRCQATDGEPHASNG